MAERTVLGQWIYVKYEPLFHLPKVLINHARKLAAAAVVAAPILKLYEA